MTYFHRARGGHGPLGPPLDPLLGSRLTVNDTREADGRLANYQASNGSGQVVRRAVADPEFPRRGIQPLSLGWKPIIWQDFCQKLHENEMNGVPGSPTTRIRQCRGAIFLTYACIRALRRAKVKRIKEIWSTSKKIFVLDSAFVRCERTLRVEYLGHVPILLIMILLPIPIGSHLPFTTIFLYKNGDRSKEVYSAIH